MDTKLKGDHWRGLDFYKPDFDSKRVLIAGAGATGSYVAFGLARMGVKNITVCDFDKVEPHNLPNQFFAETVAEENVFKTAHLQRTIDFMIGVNKVEYKMCKLEALVDTVLNYDVIVLAVDVIDARKWLFEKLKPEESFKVQVFDPSTGGEYGNLVSYNTYRKDSMVYYESYLAGMTDVFKLPCSGTSIIDTSFAIAGAVIQQYRKYDKWSYLVPMHTVYDWDLGVNYIKQAYENKTKYSSHHDSKAEVKLNPAKIVEYEETGERK